MKNSPKQIAAANSESASQQAFIAWCAMASSFGLVAANDEASYNIKGHAMRLLSCNPMDKDTLYKLAALRWLHSIPNGGARGDTANSAKLNGAIMKAEGVKKGVLDLFLPFPYNGYAGLYIEMKHGNGRLSAEQMEFKTFISENHFASRVCYTWLEARNTVMEYLGL